MDKSEKIRAFIGIRLDQHASERAHAYLTALKHQYGGQALRYVPLENLHITLKFLGDIPVESIPKLAEQLNLAIAQHKSFTLECADVIGLPLRRPKAICQAFAANTEIEHLAQTVETVCTQLDFEPSKRKYTPHLTYARLKIHPPIAKPTKENNLAGLSLRVDTIQLYQSNLSEAGSEYKILYDFKLII